MHYILLDCILVIAINSRESFERTNDFQYGDRVIGNGGYGCVHHIGNNLVCKTFFDKDDYGIEKNMLQRVSKKLPNHKNFVMAGKNRSI